MIIRVILIVAALVLVVPAVLYVATVLRPTEIRTEIEIDAPPTRVWAILSDLESYHEWNPFMVRASGTLRTDEALEVDLAPADGAPMTIGPTVLVADPGQELRWRGRVVLPGIVDGEHYFQLTPLSDGGTKLVHGEKFTGALVPFVGNVIDVEDDFAAMNAALKGRAEKMQP